MKEFLLVILSICLILIVGYVLHKSDVPNTINQDHIFEVVAQDVVSVVEIASIEMTNPGFVAIREVINNRPGQVLEVSQYLSEGLHKNITIPLPETRSSKVVMMNSEFPVTSELVAIVYLDDGDGGFNPNLDVIQFDNYGPIAKYVATGREVSKESLVAKTDDDTESSITVVYTDDGFIPNTIEIIKGETVEFKNQSSLPMWVATNDHPAHNILPTFDQFTTSAFGESWHYTFDQPGEWIYHDHVNASMEGVVVVKD